MSLRPTLLRIGDFCLIVSAAGPKLDFLVFGRAKAENKSLSVSRTALVLRPVLHYRHRQTLYRDVIHFGVIVSVLQDEKKKP